ncbi:uncharacterized protein LOC144908478 isoform X2 [Branchiostoma floridae x Branchiostoma belcheri]
MEDFLDLLFVGKKKQTKKQPKKNGGKTKDRPKKEESNLKMGQQEAKTVAEPTRRLKRVRTPPGSVSSGGTESLSSLSSGWEEIRDGCPRGITIIGRDQARQPGGRQGEAPRRQTELAPVGTTTFFDNEDPCRDGITITGGDQQAGGREGQSPRRHSGIVPVDNPIFSYENPFSLEDGGYSDATENTPGDGLSPLGWEPFPARRQSEPAPVKNRPSPFGRAGSLRKSRLNNDYNDLTRNNNFGAGQDFHTGGISEPVYADNSGISNMAACELAPTASGIPEETSYGRNVGSPAFHAEPSTGELTGGGTDGTDEGRLGRERFLNMDPTRERIGMDPAPFPTLDRAGFPTLDRTIRPRDRVAELKLLKIQMLKERRLANSQLRAHHAAAQARTQLQGYLRTFNSPESTYNTPGSTYNSPEQAFSTPGHLPHVSTPEKFSLRNFTTPEEDETSVHTIETGSDGLDPTEDPETGFHQPDPRHSLDQYLHDLTMAAESKTSLRLPPRTSSLRKPPAMRETSSKMSWREKRQQRLIGGYVQPAKQQLRRGYLRNLEDVLQEGWEGELTSENGGDQNAPNQNGGTFLSGTPQDFENQILLDTRNPPTYDDVLQGDAAYERHVLDAPRNGDLLRSQNGEDGGSYSKDRGSESKEIRGSESKDAEGPFEKFPGEQEELFQARTEGTEASIRYARDERRLYTAQTRPRAPVNTTETRSRVPVDTAETRARVPDLQDRIRRYRDERQGRKTGEIQEQTDSGHSTMKDPEESDNEFTQSTAISGLGKHSGTESEIDDSKTEAPDSQDEAMESEGEADSQLEHRHKGQGRQVTTVQRQHSTRVLPQAPRKVLSSTTAPADQKMFKVVLAGDAAVGKSSFILRLCKNEFRPNMNSTLGVDFQMKTMVIDDTPVTLQIWDTAGQERFRSIAKSYFRRADGVLLLYDCTYEPSFVHVREWVDAVEDGAPRTLPIMLCANKLDLRNDAIKSGQKVILKGHGEEMAREHGALFCETSAKEGDNVQDAVEKLMRQMMQMDSDETRSNILDLNKKEEKKSKCCGGS